MVVLPPPPPPPPAIGRPVEESSRSQKLGVTVWLAEDFPLSLQEQIVPIVELMVCDPVVWC